MKKPKVIYRNNNKSNHNLVLRRLIHNKKEKSVLDLYSHFLQPLVRRRSSQSKLSFKKESLAKKTSKKTELKVNSNSVLDNYIKNARNIRIAGVTSSFLLVLLSVSIIAPLHTNSSSTPASATSSYTKLVTTLTLTTESNIAGVDLLVKDAGGTFASSDNSGSTLGFNVSTTNLTGYTLSIVSPSDTTYNNGKLTNTDTTNCTDTTKCVLNTISSASNTISTNGTWGYKPSKLNSVENTNYLPSPTTTPTILDETDSPNTTPNPYTISIGAKADYTQPAGVYSNTYTLQATGNIVVIYMQDVTKEDMQALLPDVGDTMTLYDKRDNSDYQVTNINGEYWMTQNLRITGTISAAESNFTGNDFNVYEGDLNKNITASDFLTYTESRSHTPSSAYDSSALETYSAEELGAWYNYCAASAGSVCERTEKDATSDICPAGWRLPTNGEQSAITSYSSAYAPIYGGIYMNGTLSNYPSATGIWWSSTAASLTSQRYLLYYNDQLDASEFNYKQYGFYVRCIKSEDNYMQDATLSTLAALMPNSGDGAKLRDRRDGSIYQITNINGGYWMTQNLRITGTISSTDSNFSTNSTWSVSVRPLSAGSSHTEARSTVSSDTTVGAWYNYCAVSAGTNCQNTSTYDTTEDICPSGWRLPTDTENRSVASYYSLYQPIYGGYYQGGTLRNPTGYGFWWSSSAKDATSQYTIYNDRNVLYYNFDSKSGGFYARCIFNIPYMQSVTDSQLAELMPNDGDSTTLYDRRDGSDYQITKINNDYWMTQNLRITHTTGQNEGTILGADSDFIATSITFSGDLTSGTVYNAAYYHKPTSADLSQNGLTAEQTGVWYNFCAVAAKSGTGACANATYSGTESICPSGWKLPTNSQFGDIVGAVTIGGTNNASYFIPVYGGIYDNGSLKYAATHGYWWSSTASGTNGQYSPYYNGGSLDVSHVNKGGGFFVRCVRAS